jgi:SAM-dependent methyltransferase
MPPNVTAPFVDPLPLTGVAASAARKAEFWDRTARQYAADPIADLAGYETSIRRVQALLSPRHSVLELGCGTGTTALRLAPFAGQFLATDVSAGMIAIAQEKLAAQPVPKLSFAVADADGPIAAPCTFDVVLAFSLLHLVADLDQTLAHAVRALKPGGLLISKTPCIAEMNPLVPRLALPVMRALGKAPNVLCLKGDALAAAVARQGMDILSVERHSSRGKDVRVFIVARKPAGI